MSERNVLVIVSKTMSKPAFKALCFWTAEQSARTESRPTHKWYMMCLQHKREAHWAILKCHRINWQTQREQGAPSKCPLSEPSLGKTEGQGGNTESPASFQEESIGEHLTQQEVCPLLFPLLCGGEQKVFPRAMKTAISFSNQCGLGRKTTKDSGGSEGGTGVWVWSEGPGHRDQRLPPTSGLH